VLVRLQAEKLMNRVSVVSEAMVLFTSIFRRYHMLRGVSRLAALALVLAAASCKSDKSTGPSSPGFAGSYSGIIAGATTSGTLTITIPAGSPAAPARGPIAVEPSVDAVVTLTGALKLPGGIPPFAISGSFDNVTGQLSGVTAGPFKITGGFSGGKFTGGWTNTGTGATGGFSLLPVPSGSSALLLCGVFIGSSSGVWNLSIVGSSMVGVAASPSSTLRLNGTFDAAKNPNMNSITSPDDATVTASGALTVATNTAVGVWAAGAAGGTWSGSASACN
jgi:hypothetical protein